MVALQADERNRSAYVSRECDNSFKYECSEDSKTEALLPNRPFRGRVIATACLARIEIS